MTIQYTFTRSSDQRAGQTRGPAVLPAVCRHLQGGQSCGSRQESVSSAMLKSSRSVTSSPFSTVRNLCAARAGAQHAARAAAPRFRHPPVFLSFFCERARSFCQANLFVNLAISPLYSKKLASQLSGRSCNAITHQHANTIPTGHSAQRNIQLTVGKRI